MTRQEILAVRTVVKRIAQQEMYLIGLSRLKTSMERLLIATGKSSYGSRVENAVIKIEATKERLIRLREELELVKEELLNRIQEEVTEPDMQTLLINRYVECRTWKHVAEEMGLTRRQVYRLHEKFICHLDAQSEG